jgi:hypothetical protein
MTPDHAYRPSYNLEDVKRKITAKKVLINQNARQSAFDDFGWEWKDIVDVYSKLQPRHFYKTDQSLFKFPIWIDVYKAHLNGEDVYTHFYVDDESGNLVINSFHKDQKGISPIGR